VKILFHIAKTELLLIARSWISYPLAIFFTFIGLQLATKIRSLPIGIYSNVISGFFWFSLILGFWALAQGLRGRDRQINKIIWSTEIATWVYILGKFLGIFFMGLLYSFVYVLAAILADQFWHINVSLPFLPDNVFYPPLGWMAYLIFWLWFGILPVLVVVAVSVSSNYLSRGKRLIGYSIVLIWWAFGFQSYLPSWIDPTLGYTFNSNLDLTANNVRTVIDIAKIYISTQVFPLKLALRVMDDLRAAIPPTFLGTDFIVNRVVLSFLSVLLIVITVIVVDRRRSTSGI
jgi:hypothetical protein